MRVQRSNPVGEPLRFEAVLRPDNNLLERLAASTPLSPFNTPEYAQAQTLIGNTPCAFLTRRSEDVICGALGFLQGGRHSKILEIPTAPTLPEPEEFWSEAISFALSQGVQDLFIETFASTQPTLPKTKFETARRSRLEYVVTLLPDRPAPSKNHTRNISKARRAGVLISRGRNPTACLAHSELIDSSLDRRRIRGESIEAKTQTQFFSSVLTTGAGELYQASLDGKILSSILILRSSLAAYYQSAGTSPTGMKIGASQLLIDQAADLLAAEGVLQFNLGGASTSSPGLQQFKRGFGAEEVPSMALQLAPYSSSIDKLKRQIMRGARHAKYACLAAFRDG